MAVLVKDLKQCVLYNSVKSDKLIIISGYTTPDVIEEIANLGIDMTFYYGMYRRGGMTPLLHRKLNSLNAKYSNLTIKIVNDYHVHTKCYIFFKKGKVINALVGSANCSIDGLSSGENSEMLVELNKTELKNNSYLVRIEDYANSVDRASVHCGDPVIIVGTSKSKVAVKTKKGKIPYSGNPFIAYMPLYTYINGKKVVGKSSGINWGLQSGHSKKGTGYAEAYIPVSSEHIDMHPIVFPFFPASRSTTSGKSTRRYDPVSVLWDDGTTMEMIFSGNGCERPPKGQRKTGDPYKKYPKQFTSGADGDGGGAELGEYLRKRMNIPPRKIVTMGDLKKYKRDYIELTYIVPGFYEADFSGTPLP